MQLAVVGLGKLGAPLTAVLASKGFDIAAIDTDETAVNAVKQANVRTYEPDVNDLLKTHKDRIMPTTDFYQVERGAATFIIVPTPSKDDGAFSNDFVISASKKIGAALKNGPKKHLVVMVSTVMPFSGGREIIPAIEAASGLKCGADFSYCYSPEFIALGTVVKDLLSPDFCIIGASDGWGANILEKIYDIVHNCKTPNFKMSVLEAEITKLSVNLFLTMKIAYANALRTVCAGTGADATTITRAIGSDSRIGPKFMKPGPPFGGPCFPRDGRAFIRFAEQLNCKMPLAEAVRASEQARYHAILTKVLKYPGTRVAIIGLAYKEGTPITDESAAVRLAQDLHSKGKIVIGWDELAQPITGIVPARSLAEAVDGADTVVSFLPDLQSRVYKGALDNKNLIDLWRE